MTERVPQPLPAPAELAALAHAWTARTHEVTAGDRQRYRIGLVLCLTAIVCGIALNATFGLLEIFLSKDPPRVLAAMSIGAVFAFPMVLLYLTVPWLLDRLDPEPPLGLALTFLWGAFAATGLSLVINSGFGSFAVSTYGPKGGEAITAVLCAPITEELAKGSVLLGVVLFLRREFDGIVDGLVYATVCALGFAAVENVLYYARTLLVSETLFAQTFVLRGLVAPWGHPLYTAMTGLGFGLARETQKTWVRWCAPVLGLLTAIALHAGWNFSATILGKYFGLILLLWLFFVMGFAAIVLLLVRRESKILRTHLEDEVRLGVLTREELHRVVSVWRRVFLLWTRKGRWEARFSKAAARLALSKWHAARAATRRRYTVSSELIVPMRLELAKLRMQT